MTTIIIIIAVLVLLLAVAIPLIKKKPADDLAGISGRAILSEPELVFYHQLTRALPNLLVFPQVAVNAILQVDKQLTRAQKTSLRNRYSQWHVDFVICEPQTLKIVGIAEFDGKAHDAASDARRDRILEKGGYTVHRFPAKSRYSDEDIAARFGQHSQQPALQSRPQPILESKSQPEEPPVF